jgi:hypothetical protein
MIEISAKGLAMFMTVGDSQKRRILRNYKYPKPAGIAMAGFYRDAREAVYRYLAQGRDLDRLVRRGQDLLAKAGLCSGIERTRCRSNGRAIIAFVKNLSGLPFAATGRVRLSVSSGSVRVSASPDVQAQLKGRDVLLRFEFSNQHHDKKVPSIMCQLMADACAVQGLAVAPKDCLYIDVHGGVTYRKARAHARISGDISAAMANLAAIWPTIK